MTTRKKKHPSIHTINGYTVIMDSKHNNMLHIECVIKNGFCTETKSISGINHLLEHIMVESWKKCKLSCNTYWDNRGLYVNASTDNTTMKYYIKGLNKDAKDMVSYITHIVDNPTISQSNMVNEKQAVIDELLTYSSDPDCKADDVFNKEFYSLEGLQYADDWKLQIKNLKTLTVQKLTDIYTKHFNVQNIVFIVVGDFKVPHMIDLFQKGLTHPKQGVHLPLQCYSKSHKIIHLQNDIENTKIRIGFPSNTQEKYIHVKSFVNLMHILLFTELRSKLSLLYDIEIYNETDSCGTSIFIEFDVRPTNVIPAMKHLFKYIRHMQTIKNSHLDGFKSREMYNYLAGNKSMIDYYSTFVFSKEPLHSKTQIIDQIKQISSEDILRLSNSLLPIEEALCIYQSNRDLKLTWEKLI